MEKIKDDAKEQMLSFHQFCDNEFENMILNNFIQDYNEENVYWNC